MSYTKDAGYGRLSAMLSQYGINTFGKTFVVCPVNVSVSAGSFVIGATYTVTTIGTTDFTLVGGSNTLGSTFVATAVGTGTGKVAYTDPNYQRLSDLFGAVDNDGKVRLVNTVAAAYALCTTNANDVILLSANSSHTLTAGILWAKNRIHMIGVDDGQRLTDQGVKVQTSGSTDASGYVIKVTGMRNSFINVKFIQGCTNAAALSVVADSSEGSMYKNCSFIFGTATNLTGTTAQEFLAACDSATFINCQFGSDTLLTSGARQVLLAKTDVTEMKSNRFRDCTFTISSSSATATFIRLNAVTDILFTNLFERCNFQASVDTAGGIALTGGAIQTGTGTTKGTINLAYPCAFNCGVSLAASGNNTGVQVVAPASVTTAIKGIQPTA